jgi:murein DD-endopeptidase
MSEFNRGGLKVIIDHGNGLMTCCAHLARELVKVGEVIHRGQPIALSGYSGLDGFTTFPFGIPHVHFNVWLNGEPVDPFPHGNNESLWLGGDMPTPPDHNRTREFTPSIYSATRVNDALAICKTQSSVNRINSISDLQRKAAHTIIEMNYYPTRFDKRINIYDKEHARNALLDLPFNRGDFEKVIFLDEL